jgi:hypothetical protein
VLRPDRDHDSTTDLNAVVTLIQSDHPGLCAAGRALSRGVAKRGIESLLEGDVDAAKSILRKYINATVVVDKLARTAKSRLAKM